MIWDVLMWSGVILFALALIYKVSEKTVGGLIGELFTWFCALVYILLMLFGIVRLAIQLVMMTIK
jgi:hypothetical protein